jgi:hypothetical protein
MNAEALRPASLGEILDRAVQIFRSHFLLFAGIAAFPALATLLESVASDQAFRGVSRSLIWRITGPLLTFIFWVATLIFGALAAGAKCRAASEVLLGRPVTISSAYGAFRERKGRLIGLALWQGMLVLWPMIPVIVIATMIATGSSGNALWTIYAVVFILAGVPCAILFARYALAFAATAITDSTASDSIKRSVELGRGYRGKVFWAFALPMGIGMAIGAGGAGLLEWLGTWAHRKDLHPLLFVDLQALWTFVTTVCYEPLTSIAITLTYYDLCMRKEGFDIVQMMEKAGLTAASAEAETA